MPCHTMYNSLGYAGVITEDPFVGEAVIEGNPVRTIVGHPWRY